MNRMALVQLMLAKVLGVPSLVAQYIDAQRERFSPHALPLVAAQRTAMTGFFLPQVLDAARVYVLDGIRLKNPPFYRMLKRMGFSGLRDMSQVAAITFGDVVVSHVPFTDELLFHELVHVEQYRQLGIPRFSELYVRGFLSGGSYDGIPLETNAYDLGRRFEGNPRQQFSVTEEVTRWVQENRL